MNNKGSTGFSRHWKSGALAPGDFHLVLGIEGGGTKTDWIYLRQEKNESKVLGQGKLPGSNMRLTSRQDLETMFRLLPRDVTDAGVFLAGCLTEQDRHDLRALAMEIWPDAQIVTGSDRDSGLAAAFGNGDGITVISGTGSAVTGRKAGKIEKAGGRGHLLGDHGGAYVICVESLRLILRAYDLEHQITPAAREVLRALCLNTMDDLITWAHAADKNSISALAPVLFEAAGKDDPSIFEVIESGASALALYSRAVARWLQFANPPVVLLGGLFVNQPVYVDLYKKHQAKLFSASSVEVCAHSGAFGAAWLATQDLRPARFDESDLFIPELESSPTEQRHLRSSRLDQVELPALVDLFIEEEADVSAPLQQARPALEHGVQLFTEALRNGGNIFYVGAGTSGRLGVLDASEIPPTFSEEPDRFQGIIAGGLTALHSSVEGAEDNEQLGRLTVIERGVKKNDVVCGIAASGRTPFVIAALRQAQELGAKTMLVHCNPSRDKSFAVDVEIALNTGPELISGSTRLRAGTATKVALNILSTCSMIQLGKVYGNWMIDLHPTNRKLKYRAVRLVSKIKQIPVEEAEKLLGANNWNIRKVIE